LLYLLREVHSRVATTSRLIPSESIPVYILSRAIEKKKMWVHYRPIPVCSVVRKETYQSWAMLTHTRPGCNLSFATTSLRSLACASLTVNFQSSSFEMHEVFLY
jgi:hypothetical protein